MVDFHTDYLVVKWWSNHFKAPLIEVKMKSQLNKIRTFPLCKSQFCLYHSLDENID